jgi:hypothetical protein
MRFLLDMPVSPGLLDLLAGRGHHAEHASHLGLYQATDEELVMLARQTGSKAMVRPPAAHQAWAGGRHANEARPRGRLPPNRGQQHARLHRLRGDAGRRCDHILGDYLKV